MRIQILAQEACGTRFSSAYGMGCGRFVGDTPPPGILLDVELEISRCLHWGLDITESAFSEPFMEVKEGITTLCGVIEVDPPSSLEAWDGVLVLRIGPSLMMIEVDARASLLRQGTFLELKTDGLTLFPTGI